MTSPILPNVTSIYVDSEGWQNLVLKFDLTPIDTAPSSVADDTQLISPFFTTYELLAELDYDQST